MAPATKKKPSKPVKPQKAPKKVQIVPIKDDSTSESEEEEAPPLQHLELDGSDSDLSSDGDDQLADDFLQGSDDEDDDNDDEGVYSFLYMLLLISHFRVLMIVFMFCGERFGFGIWVGFG